MNLRKIDALIAEHFFGWVPKTLPDLDTDGWISIGWPWLEAEGEYFDSWWAPLFPTEDIRTAWEVVDKLHATDSKIDICSYVDSVGVVTYYVQIVDARGICFNVRNQSLLPLTICLAALKLKGVEVPT